MLFVLFIGLLIWMQRIVRIEEEIPHPHRNGVSSEHAALATCCGVEIQRFGPQTAFECFLPGTIARDRMLWILRHAFERITQHIDSVSRAEIELQ